MNLQKITLQQASLGEIYQHVLIALEKLCNQRIFFLEIDKVQSKHKDSCKRKDLQIKCYDKNCDCPKKEEIISRNILWKGGTMQDQGRNFSKRKNGSFLEESNSNENFQKSFLCSEDQATFQKIVQKGRKQQSFLNRRRFMQMTLPS